MDSGDNNNKKGKTKQNFLEYEGDSETELYEPSFEKDRSYYHKAFIQKKRKTEKEEMKKHCLTKESCKFLEKKNYIKYENKISEKNQYLNDELENLKNNFELKIQKLTNQIEQQNNKIEQQKYQLEKQRKEFKFKLNIVNEDNYRLKLSLKNQMEERIQSENRLLLKINELKSQVKDLDDFHFQVKLRKLIKNLLEYLFDKYYPKFMNSNIITHKLEFHRAPIIKIKEKVEEEEEDNLASTNDSEIIEALNRFLVLLFKQAKDGDYVVHFVKLNAERNSYERRYIKVFGNSTEFFSHFKINKKDQNILVKIIPSTYFTEIDNFRFDKNIEELKNIYGNGLFPYN